MTISGTWNVQFAGRRLTIIWRGDTAPAILEFLFGAPNDTDAESIKEPLEFIADTGEQLCEIFRGTRCVYTDASAGKTARSASCVAASGDASSSPDPSAASAAMMPGPPALVMTPSRLPCGRGCIAKACA